MKSKPDNDSTLQVRVYYEDTDAAGIVYHANYLKYAERARSEWLRRLGFDHGQILTEFGLIFAVKHLAIDFKKPARLDDTLEITAKLTAIGAATLVMEQIISRKGAVLAVLEVKIVAIDQKGRPAVLPPQLRQIFKASC